MDDVIKFEYYKSETEPGSVSPNQKKMRRYVICKKFKRYCCFLLSPIMLQVKKAKDKKY